MNKREIIERARRELEATGVLPKKQELAAEGELAFCPRHKQEEKDMRLCRDCKQPKICPTSRFNRSGICKECVDRVCAAQKQYMDSLNQES